MDVILLILMSILAFLMSVIQKHLMYDERFETNLGEQPMMYDKQLFVSKVPYYDDSLKYVGRPCENGCGVLGFCKDGVCKVRDQENTVFDIKLK